MNSNWRWLWRAVLISPLDQEKRGAAGWWWSFAHRAVSPGRMHRSLPLVSSGLLGSPNEERPPPAEGPIKWSGREFWSRREWSPLERRLAEPFDFLKLNQVLSPTILDLPIEDWHGESSRPTRDRPLWRNCPLAPKWDWMDPSAPIINPNGRSKFWDLLRGSL